MSEGMPKPAEGKDDGVDDSYIKLAEGRTETPEASAPPAETSAEMPTPAETSAADSVAQREEVLARLEAQQGGKNESLATPEESRGESAEGIENLMDTLNLSKEDRGKIGFASNSGEQERQLGIALLGERVRQTTSRQMAMMGTLLGGLGVAGGAVAVGATAVAGPVLFGAIALTGGVYWLMKRRQEKKSDAREKSVRDFFRSKAAAVN